MAGYKRSSLSLTLRKSRLGDSSPSSSSSYTIISPSSPSSESLPSYSAYSRASHQERLTPHHSQARHHTLPTCEKIARATKSLSNSIPSLREKSLSTHSSSDHRSENASIPVIIIVVIVVIHDLAQALRHHRVCKALLSQVLEHLAVELVVNCRTDTVSSHISLTQNYSLIDHETNSHSRTPHTYHQEDQ